MITLADSIFISIKIDNQDLGGINLVSDIAMTEGVSALFPALVMYLNDESGHLVSDLCLTDSNEILLTVGLNADDTTTQSRQYRLYMQPESMNRPSGTLLKVLALYDAPKYSLESAIESYEGTSSDVIKQIADKCKLEYDGPENFNGRSVTDSQIWLSPGMTRAKFVQQFIAPHGYMDEYSGMSASLTSLGILKYRNLNDVIETPIDKIKYLFTHNIAPGDQDNGKQIYKVYQSREKSDSGELNAIMNYGSTQITEGLSPDAKLEEKMDVKTSGRFLPINDQVAKTIGRARHSSTPIDCGNVHENFHRAVYQNTKQWGLFTERQSVLVLVPTEVQTYDPVIYKQADSDPSEPVKNSDVYFVAGKTIFIQAGTTYMERIELVRMSISEQGASSLKSSEPTAIRESAIPDTYVNASAEVAKDSLPRLASINEAISSVEGISRQYHLSAQSILPAILQTLPTLNVYGILINSIGFDPLALLKAIENGYASLQLLVDRVEDFKNRLTDGSNALRAVNTLFTSTGIPAIAQTAALFRSPGVVDSFMGSLGPMKVLNSFNSLSLNVSDYMTTHAVQLDAAAGGPSVRQSSQDYIAQINASMLALFGTTGSLFNTLVAAASLGDPFAGSITPFALANKATVYDLIDTSLDQPSNGKLLVRSSKSIKKSLAPTLLKVDETRNFKWVAETGYATVKVSNTQMIPKTKILTKQLDLALKQQEDDQQAN